MNRGFALLIGATLVLLAACSTTDAPVALNDNAALKPLAVDAAFAGEQKLTASDAAVNDFFGSSVAIDGETAIIGAAGDGSSSGSAYIFTSDGTAWTEHQKLTASDAAEADNFGHSVAIDGDTAIIGAYFDSDNGSGSGSAYIFTRTAGTWSQQQKLTASDAAEADNFGHSVAIDGDTAIIGAAGDASAYIFTSDGTTWSQQQKLTASDAVVNDFFGSSVAIEGETAIIGAYADDDVAFGLDSGSAYIFTRDGTTWSQHQKLTASDAAAFDEFGWSVALDGDTVIIGATGDGSSSGSAYIFTSDGTAWTEHQKLTASDAAAAEYFGTSVAIDGDTLLIGAVLDGDFDVRSGSAYIFTRTANTWSQHQKLTARDAAPFDIFGSSVAIDGGAAVVGARWDDDSGFSSGSAYAYRLLPPEQAIQNLIDDVDALASAGTLKRGQANGLTRPLENALRSLSRDDTEAACNQLTDFMSEVGLKTPEPLPQIEADALLASADSIRDELGCGAF